MQRYRGSIRNGAAALMVAVLASPCIAGTYSPYVESWRDRAIQGAFTSAKSSPALQQCLVATLKGLAAPAGMHSEGVTAHITEIDALGTGLGVRVVDEGSRRVLLYVSNPGMTERTAAAIKTCA